VPGQGRLGDKASVPLDTHGCLACPHPGISGPAIQGSPDVNVNRRPALRVDDPGIHAGCCGANTWTAAAGSATVFINGKGAHRMGDQTRHCGGMGQLAEGSPNVIVGESGAAAGSRAAPRAASDRTSASTNAWVAGVTGAGGAAGAPSEQAAARASTNAGAATNSSASTNARVDTSGDGIARAKPSKDDWIEIRLVDDTGKPVSGAHFRLVAPDGSVSKSITGQDGVARLDGIATGDCRISFPDLHDDEWSVA
jgi:uncharacterized Zn-binding protein involved in type VI secretion